MPLLKGENKGFDVGFASYDIAAWPFFMDDGLAGVYIHLM